MIIIIMIIMRGRRRTKNNDNNDNDDNDNNNNKINICIVPFQCKMFRSFGEILVRFYTLGILYV